jgi:hypothetical protein
VALQDVEQQIEGLVMQGRFEDALGLAEGEGEAVHDKVSSKAHVSEGRINTFSPTDWLSSMRFSRSLYSRQPNTKLQSTPF